MLFKYVLILIKVTRFGKKDNKTGYINVVRMTDWSSQDQIFVGVGVLVQ